MYATFMPKAASLPQMVWPKKVKKPEFKDKAAAAAYAAGVVDSYGYVTWTKSKPLAIRWSAVEGAPRVAAAWSLAAALLSLGIILSCTSCTVRTSLNHGPKAARSRSGLRKQWNFKVATRSRDNVRLFLKMVPLQRTDFLRKIEGWLVTPTKIERKRLTREELAALYTKHSANVIAKMLGKDHTTIFGWLHRYGITLRGRSKNRHERSVATVE